MKLGNCACVVWPNTWNLMRNYGFLHSFCNFSKSNAFGENYIRTKFIPPKIFFWMSILSSRKTLWIFFNFCSKNCKKLFATRGHDRFQGKGVSGDKNQYKPYCRKWGFKYFSLNNFFKKKFQNNREKNFWEPNHFSGNEVWDNKN